MPRGQRPAARGSAVGACRGGGRLARRNESGESSRLEGSRLEGARLPHGADGGGNRGGEGAVRRDVDAHEASQACERGDAARVRTVAGLAGEWVQARDRQQLLRQPDRSAGADEAGPCSTRRSIRTSSGWRSRSRESSIWLAKRSALRPKKRCTSATCRHTTRRGRAARDCTRFCWTRAESGTSMAITRTSGTFVPWRSCPAFCSKPDGRTCERKANERDDETPCLVRKTRIGRGVFVVKARRSGARRLPCPSERRRARTPGGRLASRWHRRCFDAPARGGPRSRSRDRTRAPASA